MNEALNVKRAKEGDRASFEDLVVSYREIVYALAVHILEDAHAAEDICQEVFLSAYAKLDALKDNSSFGAWLKKITFNRCLRYASTVRKQHEHEHRTGLIDPFIDELPDLKDEWVLYAERIEQAVKELTGPQCMLLDMFYIRGLTHKQIAGFLEIPEGTVRRRLFDTRKSLQENIEDLEDMPIDREKAAVFLDALRSSLEKKIGNKAALT